MFLKLRGLKTTCFIRYTQETVTSIYHIYRSLLASIKEHFCHLYKVKNTDKNNIFVDLGGPNENTRPS